MDGVWRPRPPNFAWEMPAEHEHAEAAVALATEHVRQWAAYGTSLRGWALAMQGQGEEGLAQIRQGIAAWQATGAAVFVPYLSTLLAESLPIWATRQMASRRWPRPTPWWRSMRNATGKPNRSPPGRLTPAADGDAADRGRDLLPARPDFARRQQANPGAACRHEPGAPVAATGQAR